MKRDPRAFLWEAREAAIAIGQFTAGLDAAGYAASTLVQAAVERKFEVIGEALNQLGKVEPHTAAQVPDLAKIVAFRNQLIHGYATVNPNTVWTIAQTSLPNLVAALEGLLAEKK